MNNNIKDLVNKYKKFSNFNYAKVTQKIIADAEKILRIKLPEEYIEYIKEYGQGGIGGVEIIGVGLTGNPLFVEKTLEKRNEGLPNNLVVVENVDEWLMCIDCDSKEIVSWDDTGYIRKEFDNFNDFVISEFNDAIENL